MSDTPRTDAAVREVDVAFVGYDGLASEPQKFVEPDFARELERENAALREELKAARKLLDTHLLRSDLFSYLTWLEEHRDRDMDLKGAEYLVLSSDGTTCWGKTFMEAVQVAEQHDRALFDAARKEAQP